MGIEAKPPIRTGPGAGTTLLAVFAILFFCGAIFAGLSLLGFRMLGRSESVSADPFHEQTYAPAFDEPLSADFVARLTAAKRIYATTDRDDALRSLASKYAQNSSEAISAIREIRANEERDWAAWDVARRFSETNQSHYAVAVADLIQTRSISDSASRAIATGEWPEAPGSRYVSELSAVTAEAVAEEAAH